MKRHVKNKARSCVLFSGVILSLEMSAKSKNRHYLCM